MELRVPRTTAYIQDHTVLGPDDTLEPVGDGSEFCWSLKRSSSDYNDGQGGTGCSGTFREDDVVLICRESEQEPPPEPESELDKGELPPLPSSALPTNKPPAAAGYAIYLVRENPDGDGGGDEPYHLSCVSAPGLPQPLLDRHLLTAVPAHLVGRGSKSAAAAAATAAPDLHVIVSTKSGTGLAQAVYDTVLGKLLGAVLGLRAGDGLTPPDSPGGGGGGGSARSESAAAAAAGAAAIRVEEVEESVRPSYNLFVTQSPHSIRQLARARWSAEALRRRRHEEVRGVATTAADKGQRRQQLIVLLSGDGGVVDLLNGAGEPDDDGDDETATAASSSSLPAIALLPLGTGNALFHSLHRPLYGNSSSGGGGGPSHLVRGLRTLFRGAPAPLPTFRASFSPGSTLVPPASPAAVAAREGEEQEREQGEEEEVGEPVDHLVGAIVASYGFHAQLVWESDTPEYRRHGARRFGMAAAELLKIGHAYDAEVRLGLPGAAAGGKEEEKQEVVVRPRGANNGDKFTYVLAAMASSLERTFTISPASRPLDGRLWLVSFGAVGAGKAMEIMQAAYNDGAHVDMVDDDDDDGDGDGGGGGKVVGYDEADAVTVVTHEEHARWRKVCVDGTIVELPRHGAMTVRKVARPRFRVLVDGGVLV
ncbi:hypothetical protein GGTG_08537 [Gaeumannomyces tritici R3-111a-1]|uniref:DAGKc domain-containing protein n=1 Tax=Gaeumannomyces tritici (strain R3-111a-1) TaxID=644352 RepID=J3P4V1_GAET3|nr:hypothetical protein GGTG_08537 [Gaeumannomyces tritici R3-111a-1]EJT74699.1 hypothetical protein GGTG_08537 [Gaeumannomyces tritici R3-111a-1]